LLVEGNSFNMKSLTEEQKRMRELMGFTYKDNSHDILSEQNMDLLLEGKLKGRGDTRTGIANFTAYSQEVAYFKNIKMFDDFRRGQRFEITSHRDNTAGPTQQNMIIDPPKPKPEPIDVIEEEPISINIPFSVDDPFQFDDDVLYTEAENKLNKFISDVNNLRENKLYDSKVIDAYYEFLKSKPISVFGYASIDALSNYKITGSDNTSCGGKERLRHDYNKCLSKVRAEAIIEKLKASDGILSELNYIAKGMGETNKFSGKKWNNNVADPTTDKNSPFTTKDTKKDRKFSVVLPTFTYEEPAPPTPEPIDDTYPGWVEPRITLYNPEALKVLHSDPDYSQRDERGQYKDENIQNINTISLMDNKCITFDETIENKQHPHKLKDGRVVYPLKGDLRIMSPDECYKNKFDIGSFLGIGKKIIGCTVDQNSKNLLFRESQLDHVLGKGWMEKYFFPFWVFETGKYPMEISKKEITVYDNSNTAYTFPYKSDNLLYGNVSTPKKWIARPFGSNQIIINNRGWYTIKKQENYSIQDDGNNGQFPFGGG